MFTRLIALVQRRADDPLYGIGGVIIGGYGFGKGLYEGMHESSIMDDGYIWRPTMYASVAGGCGCMVGLFWPEAFLTLLSVDICKSCTRDPVVVPHGEN